MEIRNSKTEMPLFKIKGEKFIFAVQMKLQGKCRVVGENRMEKIKLTDICNPKQWKTIPTSELLEDGYPVYGANGIIGYYSEFNHKNPVITVTCRGATCGTINITVPKSYVTGNAMCLDDVRSDIYMEYLYYCLKHYNFNNVISGSAQPQITRQGMEKIYVTIGSHNEQMDIVDKLKKVENVIGLKKQELKQLDTFVKSRFAEMFGDPIQNPYNWSIKSLLEMGYCKNGMNFHTGDSGIELYCLGVGDFKNYSIIDGTDQLSKISLNEMPPEESMLQNGDIVFVRSNGNKDLVGRCVLVYPHDVQTTYSGFCIRYRLTSREVNKNYLLRVLKTDSMRKQMTGRGANIQNLNQKTLATLNIPIPPIELQNQFADFVASIDKSKSKIQKSLQETQLLFDSLMQKYFG